jgi:hypothetical protein
LHAVPGTGLALELMRELAIGLAALAPASPLILELLLSNRFRRPLIPRN